MTNNLYSLGEETEQIEFKKSTGELKEGVISILLYAFTVIAGKVGERLCILEREMHKLMHKLMNNLRVWRNALSLSASCREL